MKHSQPNRSSKFEFIVAKLTRCQTVINIFRYCHDILEYSLVILAYDFSTKLFALVTGFIFLFQYIVVNLHTKKQYICAHPPPTPIMRRAGSYSDYSIHSVILRTPLHFYVAIFSKPYRERI